MDALATLRAEIAKKKAALSGGAATQSKNGVIRKRWRSKADIEKERKEQYLEEEKAEAKRQEERRKRKLRESGLEYEKGNGGGRQPTQSSPKRRRTGAGSIGKQNASEQVSVEPSDTPPLSKSEVYKRLRAMKEPATLFGETLWDRFYRLRTLELAREEASEGQRNIFQTKLREMEAKEAKDEMYRYAGARMPQLESKTRNSKDEQEEGLGEDGPTCKEDFVHMNIRKYLRLWKSEIDGMSPEERKTMKGRSSAATYEQTKEWLRPLEKLLRKRKLSRNILDALRVILEAAEHREYVRANTLYLERLAIGNAPWPMGATMVGIHARAAREKIGEDKIAHVMNDEQTRKYIQAVKRLLTVAQRHFPNTYSKMIL